jgi:hypothetical protein
MILLNRQSADAGVMILLNRQSADAGVMMLLNRYDMVTQQLTATHFHIPSGS